MWNEYDALPPKKREQKATPSLNKYYLSIYLSQELLNHTSNEHPDHQDL
jgi:hypothetical protein